MSEVKRKILLVSTSASMASGASWSLVGLAENLIKKGNSVCILIPSSGNLEVVCKEHQIPYKKIRHYSVGWIKLLPGVESNSQLNVKKPLQLAVNQIAAVQILLFLAKEKFDIVHINASTDGLVGEIAVRMGMNVVWHIREFLEEDLLKEFCKRKHAIKVMNHSRRIIAISESVKQKYIGEFGEKIAVIYNGIDVKKFFSERTILQGPQVNICVAGRISAAKGQEQVIQAVVTLLKQGVSNLHLQIIGSPQYPSYMEKLKKIVSDSGFEDHIEFVGFTTKIEDYFRKADIICVSSKKEAFGRVTVEAMASGALVIGADTGGTAELVSNMKYGLLYEEGNATSLMKQIQYAIEHLSEARKMASDARSWACECFTAQRNADRIAEVYDEINGRDQE